MARNRCEYCGERIAFPVPRKTGEIVCQECWEDEEEKNERKRRLGPSESGEAADRRYHGGLGHRGEW